MKLFKSFQPLKYLRFPRPVHRFVERIVELFLTKDVALLVALTILQSIVAGIGWVIPLVIYSEFLSSSIYLREIQLHTGKSMMLVVFVVLVCYQSFSFLMSRPAPVQDDESPDPVRMSHVRVRWYQFQIVGLAFGAFVWASMAFLMMQFAITPLAVGHLWCALLSAVVGIRLSVLILDETKTADYVRITQEVEEVINTTPGIVKGGMSNSLFPPSPTGTNGTNAAAQH